MDPLVHSFEGTVPLRVPSSPKPCFTFYRIFGEIHSSLEQGRKRIPPVVILHGGPGAGHQYHLPFARLWPLFGIPVIFYDQIGCGASTHLREKADDREFWCEELFTSELENLLDHLNLREVGFHLFGHSWGAMLAASFAAKRPEGLRRLVLASGLATMELGLAGIGRWREHLPVKERRASADAVDKKQFADETFLAAFTMLMKMILCRAEPFPQPELQATRKNQAEDPTVYRSMYGPTCLVNSGSLQGWTVIERLPSINVPTFVYNGEFNSSDDHCVQPFFDLIPRVRWKTYSNAAHMCHLEGPHLRERVIREVGEFFAECTVAPQRS